LDAGVSTRRRPDAVAIDRPTTLPSPRERDRTDEGIVVLRPGLGLEAARSTVTRFFAVIASEDPTALRQLFLPGATSENPNTSAREDAYLFWIRRFSRLDYQLVASVAPPTITVESEDSPDATGLEVLKVSPNRSVFGQQLFGESITFILRRSGSQYLVERIVEDFIIP
jgi:hypothetical protein